jgi:hypothetical protein
MPTIELPYDQIAALKAKASAQGLSLEAWLKKLAQDESAPRAKPLKSAYGLLAAYGPAPSAEEIDENRRDVFRGFGEDFQMIAAVADTHAALWYLFGDDRLSARAKSFYRSGGH